jgi:hypothetical protein
MRVVDERSLREVMVTAMGTAGNPQRFSTSCDWRREHLCEKANEDAFAAVLEGILRALTELMTTAGSIKIQLTELCKINHPLAH